MASALAGSTQTSCGWRWMSACWASASIWRARVSSAETRMSFAMAMSPVVAGCRRGAPQGEGVELPPTPPTPITKVLPLLGGLLNDWL